MNRKETIKHFIKWYCYTTNSDCNKGVMLKILDNYIKGGIFLLRLCLMFITN